MASNVYQVSTDNQRAQLQQSRQRRPSSRDNPISQREIRSRIARIMSSDDGHVRVTYNQIHRTIGETASKIREEFDPDIMIAIGGGGFFPARVLRTFLKTPGRNNISIQAIGLSLYEELGSAGSGLPSTEEKLGKEVVRLDFSTLGHTPLLGRRILIVDEVDDTRTTLSYAVAELQKDVKNQLERLKPEERLGIPPTQFAVFVVHNKNKSKTAQLPEYVKYFAGRNIEDQWIDYPWEVIDIDAHEALAKASPSSI